jgi:hypothetical protein
MRIKHLRQAKRRAQRFAPSLLTPDPTCAKQTRRPERALWGLAQVNRGHRGSAVRPYDDPRPNFHPEATRNELKPSMPPPTILRHHHTHRPCTPDLLSPPVP